MKNVILALIFTGLAASTARADDFELGVEGGVMQTNDQHPEAAWGLRAGVNVSGPLRLQARYLQTDAIRELGGQARVSLLPFALTPYAFVGIARRWITDDGAWFAPIGGGLDIPLAPFVRLAPELTLQHLVSTPQPLTDPSLSRDGWNVSLVLHFDI